MTDTSPVIFVVIGDYSGCFFPSEQTFIIGLFEFPQSFDILLSMEPHAPVSNIFF